MAVNYRDPNVLRRHIRRIIDFYHPACIDSERGGYINQFTDDGTIYDRDTKHLVGTCRFIFNYAVAAELFGGGEYRSAAAHGVAFLQSAHRQSDGGFAWVLGPRGVEDGTRHCYGHAFVLLAAALAARAGVSEADTLTGEVYELLEERFWDPGARLYVDEIAAGNWREISPYRGQNANMHLCEAMLAAFETSREDRYLDRALTLAKRICVELAAPAQGLIWEHYTTDWQHDWEYNRDDAKNLFRPYGYLPGHFVEWAKLLLILERHRAEPWLAPAAARLFDTALQRSWDQEQGGMHYAFAPDGTILDTDRYYWVLAETVAAAALLAVRTGEARYWTGTTAPGTTPTAISWITRTARGTGSWTVAGTATTTRRARRARPITTRSAPVTRFCAPCATKATKAIKANKAIKAIKANKANKANKDCAAALPRRPLGARRCAVGSSCSRRPCGPAASATTRSGRSCPR